LGNLYNGGIFPTLNHRRRDYPLDRARCGIRRDFAAEHEPPVIMVHAPVVQFYVRVFGFDGQSVVRVVGA
jgi:hypothetical protein